MGAVESRRKSRSRRRLGFSLGSSDAHCAD